MRREFPPADKIKFVRYYFLLRKNLAVFEIVSIITDEK